MKLKTTLRLNFLFFPIVFILLVSNANAFLVTTELNSLSVEFVPADPHSTMSIEWDNSSVHMSATAYQQTGPDTYLNTNSASLYEPESTTVVAATKDTTVTVGIDDSDATFTADMGEDTVDGLD